MERAVVDASVIVKWFVPEKDSEKAIRLLEKYSAGKLELITPTLAIYETLNALRFHPHYKLSSNELLDALKTLVELQITIEPSIKAWSKSIQLSLKHEITIYDAMYAATAHEIGAYLITADRKLIGKLSTVQNIKVQQLDIDIT